ncbi:hydroxyproline dehydrogenase isoform X2 [Phyllopteryx taeniolatus]|nr:hydroxyproline dehydrogenase isoform X2 [Phyllopteryx taeniolatus]XP_061613068.1 hydroxyproline dehydrogenase isoform X2 [Phyllopteryx taeniolatus]
MMRTRLCSSRLYLLSPRLMSTASPRVLQASDKPPDLLASSLAFEDPSAFRVKSLRDLFRALAVFRFCSFPVLVNNCNKLMSAARSILGRRLFSSLMRSTVYAQFVAGENEKEIAQSMETMSVLGLRPMLAVPIEEDLGESTGEERYDENVDAMLECVQMSHSNAWSKDPMMQLKVTALLSPELCVKVTKVISNQAYDLDLLVRAMDGEDVKFPGLEESDAAHFHCSLRRLNRIAEAGVNKVQVLVDAEYTYINPALSLVTMAMMKKFNKDGAWIWNTYQCYLKETSTLLHEAISLSQEEGFCLGVKLVRGAYMDKERKLAVNEGRPDPVQDSWEDTNNNYNSLLEMMLRLIAQDPERYRIIVATHNEESVRKAATWVEELGIDKARGSVCFGQLLGMCDHVSLTLAKEGYAVYKSVPYGSVDDTLPYLVRRAQENQSVLKDIRKERDLLRQELYRRLRLRTRQE